MHECIEKVVGRVEQIKQAHARGIFVNLPESMTLAVEMLIVSAPSPPVPTISNNLPVLFCVVLYTFILNSIIHLI